MTNPYYNYGPEAVINPFARARAEELDAEFVAITEAFLLVSQNIGQTGASEIINFGTNAPVSAAVIDFGLNAPVSAPVINFGD